MLIKIEAKEFFHLNNIKKMNNHNHNQITHYFFHIGSETQTKNKLEKDFREYLLTLEGLLITAEELTALKEQIIAKAEELNKLHSRCNPLNISFYKNFKGNIQLSGYYCLLVYIKPAFFFKLSN